MNRSLAFVRVFHHGVCDIQAFMFYAIRTLAPVSIIPFKDVAAMYSIPLECMTHLSLPSYSRLPTVLKAPARRLLEKRNPCRMPNMLLVKQTSKPVNNHRAYQKIVPKEPSVGRALRGLAGLLLGSTVGFRCLCVRVSVDIL